MGRKRYSGRRAGNGKGSVVFDSAAIANSLGPRGALITGVFGYITFYFLFPAALDAWADYNKAKMAGPLAPIFGKLLDDIFLRRFIHPCEWAGIAILLVCLTIATWKAISRTDLNREDEQHLTTLGKVLARFLD